MNLTEKFAENVFSDAVQKETLPSEVYNALRATVEAGEQLDVSIAGTVASAMKKWAVSKGATHYTHWFQPLTGYTAEKHESFLDVEGGRAIMRLTGKSLIVGEGDASSFPSGGTRATHMARGYTAWDPTSPAFVRGGTLYIPSVFVSHTGETLDNKSPLLRSMSAISVQAKRILKLFGGSCKKVIPCVGCEQEYFLVDENLYMKRTDLMFAGRTLFGAPAPKGQEMEDHYFGVIRERVGAYMKDLNEELWKLGVTAKTQHNEVAPAQHELAPIYETANIAVDHNQIVMETMKRVAIEHGMRCLLHEKPYAGVNGSGKHDNWSITTDNGVNLLDPGETPNENIQFLLVLACIMKAVDTHADLLRQSASDVGNDHRLGANEAPPAIISIFLGEQLEDVVNQLIETGFATTVKEGGRLLTGVKTLPDFQKDATDRNRTSPFAFTGNKFEFRMVGSADSIASPNTTLNAIVAEAFCEAADRLEKEEDKEIAIHDLIKEYMTKHQRIIFNGNGYADEWVEEAKRRGLPNIKSMIEAADTLTTDKAVRLFEKFGIFTKVELESREEIIYETYAKTINIEALTMIDMAGKQIIPAVVKYTRMLADTVNAVKAAGVDASMQTELLRSVGEKLVSMQASYMKLKKVEEQASSMENAKEQAFFYKDTVKKVMEELRVPADELEMIVDKEMWPIPTYGELMFEI